VLPALAHLEALIASFFASFVKVFPNNFLPTPLCKAKADFINLGILVAYLPAVTAKEAPPVAAAHIPSLIPAPTKKDNPFVTSLAQKLAVPIFSKKFISCSSFE